MRFSVAARIKSFGYAFAGFAYMLRTQHNAWMHLLATIVVVVIAATLLGVITLAPYITAFWR